MFDFRLSEEQQLIQRTVREFLANECPRAWVREIEASGLGYDPRLYAQIAELGWLGFLIPEAYGGSGLGWVGTAGRWPRMQRCVPVSPTCTGRPSSAGC
jgi:alkylation response protein AidB-like acyl-CoA dehydrogenase